VTTTSANSTLLKTVNNNNNNTFVSQYQQHLNNLNQQQQHQQHPVLHQHNPHQNINNNTGVPTSQTTTRMPKNEPVKVVYPASSQQSQAAVLTMNNNRVTFTSAAPLQNGTITLSQLTSQQNQQQAGGGTNVMPSNIKITGTSIAATGQPQQTLIFKNANSSAPVFTTSTPGIMTMSKTVNNQVTTLIFSSTGTFLQSLFSALLFSVLRLSYLLFFLVFDVLFG
jgi:hypothetical protein